MASKKKIFQQNRLRSTNARSLVSRVLNCGWCCTQRRFNWHIQSTGSIRCIVCYPGGGRSSWDPTESHREFSESRGRVCVLNSGEGKLCLCCCCVKIATESASPHSHIRVAVVESRAGIQQIHHQPSLGLPYKSEETSLWFFRVSFGARINLRVCV